MQALAEEMLAAPGYVLFEFPFKRKGVTKVHGDVQFNAHSVPLHYAETLRVGAHIVHSFTYTERVTLEFLLARFAAWHALWAQELNPMFGVLGPLTFEQRLFLTIEAPDDVKDIGPCPVCYERTTVKTNCYNAGRKNAHFLCVECIESVSACPYKCISTLYDDLDDMVDPAPKLRCDCCPRRWFAAD